MTRKSGNMDKTQVGGNMDMTRIGEHLDTTSVGENMDMTRIGGNMDMTRLGGNMDKTNDPSEPVAAINPPKETAKNSEESMRGDELEWETMEEQFLPQSSAARPVLSSLTRLSQLTGLASSPQPEERTEYLSRMPEFNTSVADLSRFSPAVESTRLEFSRTAVTPAVDFSLLAREERARENDAELKSQIKELENVRNVLQEQLNEAIKGKNSLIQEVEKLRLKMESQEMKEFDDKEELIIKITKLEDTVNEKEVAAKMNLNEKEKMLEKVSNLENSVSNLSKQKENNAIRIIELETRNGGIEKDLVTKDDYVKELEDIMLEKDFKITELENQIDSSVNLEKIKTLEDNNKQMETKINELTKAAESFQSESAKRFNLMEKEQEISKLKSLELSKLESEVAECKSVIRTLQKATKDHALLTEKSHEDQVQIEKLNEHIAELKNLSNDSQKLKQVNEQLKQDLNDKQKETAMVQEKVEKLLKDIGAKENEKEQTERKVEMLQADADASNYDVAKLRKEKKELMDHYEKEFKKAQSEMDAMKAEKLKLGETMVRATPSKKEEQLKDQLNKTEQKLKECKEKLEEDEAKICELKSELNNLQKQLEMGNGAAAAPSPDPAQLQRSPNIATPLSPLQQPEWQEDFSAVHEEPGEVWENSLRRSSSESLLRRSPPTKVRRSLSCSPPPKKKMGRPPLKVGLICPWCELPKGSTEENLRRHERDCLVRLDIQGGKPLPYKTGSLSWKTRAARKGR